MSLSDNKLSLSQMMYEVPGWHGNLVKTEARSFVSHHMMNTLSYPHSH